VINIWVQQTADEQGSGDVEQQQEPEQYDDEYQQNYDDEGGQDKNQGSGEQVPIQRQRPYF
jgi:hypothetical protein